MEIVDRHHSEKEKRPSNFAIADYTPLIEIAKNTVTNILRGYSAHVPKLSFPARGLQAVLVSLHCRRSSMLLGRAFRLNQENQLLVQDVSHCATDALWSAERKGRLSSLFLDSLHLELRVFHNLELISDWTMLLELGNPQMNETINIDKFSEIFKVTQLSEFHL